jgi:hypothetical protein
VQPGVEVKFEITAGPNQGLTGTATTDSAGKATFTWSSTKGGTDTVTASATLLANRELPVNVSETATKEWIAPPPPPPPVVVQSAPPAVQVVLPARVRSGSARLFSKAGCVRSSSFRAQVAGRSIASVTFRLDGKLVQVLDRQKSGARYTVRISARGLSVGAHRVSATVKFLSESKTKSKSLVSTFQICAKQIVAPQFTG